MSSKKEQQYKEEIQTLEERCDALGTDLGETRCLQDQEEKRARELERRCTDYNAVSKDYAEIQQKYRELLATSEELRSQYNSEHEQNLEVPMNYSI